MTRTKFALITALICATAPLALPQTRGGNSSAQAQVSLEQKVDQLFKQWDKPDSPGCALGVIKDGQFVYQRGYGSANLDHNIPITSKSVFYIASMSKQFTAMSIALLVKQGKLSLDDDIRKYLSEMPAYQRPITVRHLIHHTSGIRDFVVLMDIAGFSTSVARSDDEAYETMARTTNEEVFKLIARQKGLNFAPGERNTVTATPTTSCWRKLSKGLVVNPYLNLQRKISSSHSAWSTRTTTMI
jgi:CubicO group peptidase (beta-lactamase class C family)